MTFVLAKNVSARKNFRELRLTPKIKLGRRKKPAIMLTTIGLVDLFLNEGDPYRRDVQTRLADGISYTCYISRFLVLPVPTVALNLQDPSLVPVNPMTFFVGMLGQLGLKQELRSMQR
jgi:hypothetical protein